MEPDIEMCKDCDEPTGCAGINEDSLYCELCGGGPLCEYCYERHEFYETLAEGENE
jgi:hypothetical protein